MTWVFFIEKTGGVHSVHLLFFVCSNVQSRMQIGISFTPTTLEKYGCRTICKGNFIRDAEKDTCLPVKLNFFNLKKKLNPFLRKTQLF